MAGFDYHLTKPYDPNALVALLTQHVKPGEGAAQMPSPPEPGDATEKGGDTEG